MRGSCAKATFAAVFTYDGTLIDLAAVVGFAPEAADVIRRSVSDTPGTRRCR